MVSDGSKARRSLEGGFDGTQNSKGASKTNSSPNKGSQQNFVGEKSQKAEDKKSSKKKSRKKL